MSYSITFVSADLMIGVVTSGDEEVAMQEARIDYLSSSFLERVRRSYKLALDSVQDRYGHIWETIDQCRAPVHAALLAESNDELRNIFSNPVSSDLFLGVDHLCHSVLGQLSPIRKPSERTIPSPYMIDGVQAFEEHGISDYFANVTSKNLSALARACGIEPSHQTSADYEKMLHSLDRLLGHRILFPNFPAELGLTTTRGIATDRAIRALYQAWRALTLVANRSDPSVIEIGPGAGRTAYYAYCGGINDYTTVDLPMGMAAQACFLGRALGPDKIWMLADDAELAGGRIKLLVGHLPDRKYTLALNADSLPEMTFNIASEYLKWIRHHCQLFLSINYDANWFTVEALSTKWLKLSKSVLCPVAPTDGGYAEQIFIPRPMILPVMAWHRLAWHAAKIFGWRAASSFKRRLRLLPKAMRNYVQ
jgi:hypothetical protein